MSGADRPDARPVRGGATIAVLLLVALATLVAVRVDRSIVVDAAAPAAAPIARAQPWPDMRIDVNTATAAELRVLPGVGPRLAERIVDDRAARGPFRTVDELDRVHRVGPALVASIRPHAVAE